LMLAGKHVPVWSSTWTNQCKDVLWWWKTYVNKSTKDPWGDYISKLQKKQYVVWPGPKCYDCEGAKYQYKAMYPDVGNVVDAAVHVASKTGRIWKGIDDCMPKAPPLPQPSPPTRPPPPRTEPPPPRPDPPAQRYPKCNSASSDPDGDGWGWENNQSCLVESQEYDKKMKDEYDRKMKDDYDRKMKDDYDRKMKDDYDRKMKDEYDSSVAKI